jgi:hypothetical protein
MGDEDGDYELALASLISGLQAHPEQEPIASELEVLQSIYEPGAVRVWHGANGSDNERNGSLDTSGQPIRYELRLRYAPVSLFRPFDFSDVRAAFIFLELTNPARRRSTPVACIPSTWIP